MLFLSHSGPESRQAALLAEALKRAGLSVWLDVEQLVPGDLWSKELERALDEATAFAVYVGASGVGGWVDREVRFALQRSIANPDFRVVPILGPGSEPRTLPPFLSQYQWLDLRYGIPDPEELARLLRSLLASPGSAALQEPTKEIPFRGLLPFSQEHSHLFFGRDREVRTLIERLQASSLVTVVGESGSGKSSLIRAGLIPSLRRGRLARSGTWIEEWRVGILRPADDPIRELATALASLDPGLSSVERLEATRHCLDLLRSDDLGGSLKACIAALVPPSVGVLIVVDQLEEIFTLTKDRRTRQRFVTVLLAGLEGSQSTPLHTVLALRADFYHRCWELPQLLRRLVPTQVAVGGMTETQLKEVIERPLEVTGGQIEAGLTELLIREVKGETGGLPLLQHVLLQLWEGCSDNQITVEGYHRAGGFHGALTKYADDVFLALSPEQRRIARRIFLRLVEPGDEAADTKRPVARRLLGDQGPSSSTNEVVARLVAARLLTLGRTDEPDRLDERIEISHEILVRKWDRLKSWLEEDHEFLVWSCNLRRRLSEWEVADRTPELLLRGLPLAQAQRQLADRPVDVGIDEAAYIRESAEVETASRNRKRMLSFAAATVVLGLSCVALILGAAERRRAAELRDVGSELRANGLLVGATNVDDPLVGALLLSEIDELHPPREGLRTAYSVLDKRRPYAVLPPQGTGLKKIEFSPSGRAVLTLDDDHRALLWLLENGTRPAVLGSSRGGVSAFTFNADGGLLAVASESGALRIVKADTGKDWKTLSTELRDVVALAFSPDSGSLAAAPANGEVRILPIDAEGRRVSLKGATTVVDISYSPSGEHLVEGSTDGVLKIWDPLKGTKVATIGRHEAAVASVSFHPDGDRVLSSGADGAVIEWSAGVERDKRILLRSDSRAIRASYGSNGNVVLAVFSDGVAKVWRRGRRTLILRSDKREEVALEVGSDSVSERQRDMMRVGGLAFGDTIVVAAGAVGQVPSAALCSGGGEVVTSLYTDTPKVWNVEDAESGSESLVGHQEAVTDVDCSEHGEWIGTASADGIARIWSNRGTGDPLVLRLKSGSTRGRFGPQGQVILTARTGGRAELWDLGSKEVVARIDGLGGDVEAWGFGKTESEILLSDSVSSQVVYGLATDDRQKDGQVVEQEGTPIGTRLYAGYALTAMRSATGSVQIEDTSQAGAAVSLQAQHGGHERAWFCWDGNHVVTLDADRVLRLWETKTGVLTREFSPEDGKVEDVAFTRQDDVVILSSNLSNLVRMWHHGDRSKTSVIGQTSGAVRSLSFDRAGELLTVAASGSPTEIWRVSSKSGHDLLGRYGGEARLINSAPNGLYSVTVAADGTVRLWNAEGTLNRVLMREAGSWHGILTDFSPSSNEVAVYHRSKISVFPLAGPERDPVAIDGLWDVSALRFTGDGQRVLTATSTGLVTRWAIDGTPMNEEYFSLGMRADTPFLVALGPAGASIMMSWPDGAYLWALGLNEDPITLTKAGDPLIRASFSPDGEYLVAVDDRGSISAWRTRPPAKQIRLGEVGGRVNALAVSAKLRAVAVSESLRSHHVVLWSPNSGSLATLLAETTELRQPVLAPDGSSLLARGDDGSFRVFGLGDREEPRRLEGVNGYVTNLRFSGNGQYIVGATRDDRLIGWSTDGKQLFAVPYDRHVRALAVSQAGDVVAVVTSGSIELLRPGSGTGSTLDPGVYGKPTAMAFSEGGSRLDVVFERDSSRFFWWRPFQERSLSRIRGVSGAGYRAAFNVDRSVVAITSTSGEILLVRSGSPEAYRTLTGHMDTVNAVSFRPNEPGLASVSDDGTARFWPLDGRAAVVAAKGDDDEWMTAVSFSPDGDRAAVGSDMGLLRLWEAGRGREPRRLNGHFDSIESVSFNNAGTQIVTASLDHTARLWSARESGASIELIGHEGGVNEAVFSPDDEFVATASDDETVRIWSSRDGEPIRVLKGHTDSVSSVSFSSDGQWILANSDDGLVRIWPHGWQAVVGHARDTTFACMTTEMRQQFLGESHAIAAQSESRCEAQPQELLSRDLAPADVAIAQTLLDLEPARDDFK